MSTIQATKSKAVMTFNYGKKHYAKSMASEFGVLIKDLSKDELEIEDKIIDLAKRCTLKKMKIVICDFEYAAGSADIN